MANWTPRPTGLLPDSLAHDSRLAAFDALLSRIQQLDTAPTLVNLVDSVSSEALPSLGEQFHVMGHEGWYLASTDEQRRALIKRAIELHRYRGTRYALDEVLAIFGVTAELAEWWQQNPPATPYTFDLLLWVNDNLLPGQPTLTAGLYDSLRRMVDVVKPARSGYSFKLGVRFDQPTWSLANAQQTAAIGRWASTAQAVQPTPAVQPIRLASTVATTAACRSTAEPLAVQPTPAEQPLRVANAQQAHGVARRSAEPLPVQPTAALNPVRLASACRPLSVLRVSMEVQ